ncbi:MAG: iron ABC transporter permease, partial [Burkholderiaceae bacterium]
MRLNLTVPVLLALGALALFVLPWYGERIEGSALSLAWSGGRWWLAPTLLGLLMVLVGWRLSSGSVLRGRLMTAGALFGLLWILLQGFAVGMQGLDWSWFSIFGTVKDGQPGLGLGGFLALGVFTILLSQGIAAMGKFRGDGFISGSVWSIALLVGLFVFFPVARVLLSAFTNQTGALDLALAWERLTASDIWGLACLVGGATCGVAWNSLFLAVLAGVLSTLLGLAFALIALRSGFRWRKSLQVLSILPIITPPFVIALAIIVLFGRTGMVTVWMETWFGIVPSRWIYGLPGVLI